MVLTYRSIKKIKVHFTILNPSVSGHNRRIHELLCRSQRFNRHRCLFYHHDEECLETLIIWLKEQDFTSIFCRFWWLSVCTTTCSFSIITASRNCANYSQSAQIIPRCFSRLSLRGSEHNQIAYLASSHSVGLSFFFPHPWHVFCFLRRAAPFFSDFCSGSLWLLNIFPSSSLRYSSVRQRVQEEETEIFWKGCGLGQTVINTRKPVPGGSRSPLTCTAASWLLGSYLWDGTTAQLSAGNTWVPNAGRLEGETIQEGMTQTRINAKCSLKCCFFPCLQLNIEAPFLCMPCFKPLCDCL